MRMDIRLDGVEYKGEEVNATDFEGWARKWAGLLRDGAYVQHYLANGDILVLGSEAMQRAHFIFKKEDEAS